MHSYLTHINPDITEKLMVQPRKSHPDINWKIVEWDVKNQIIQTKILCWGLTVQTWGPWCPGIAHLSFHWYFLLGYTSEISHIPWWSCFSMDPIHFKHLCRGPPIDYFCQLFSVQISCFREDYLSFLSHNGSHVIWEIKFVLAIFIGHLVTILSKCFQFWPFVRGYV